MRDLKSYFYENRIFFNEQVAINLDKLFIDLKEIFIEFSCSVKQNNNSNDWSKLWKKISEDEIPDIKKLIEEDFREMLGSKQD